MWNKGFPERIHGCVGPQNVAPGEELMVWGEALWNTPIFTCPAPQPRVKPIPCGKIYFEPWIWASSAPKIAGNGGTGAVPDGQRGSN